MMPDADDFDRLHLLCKRLEPLEQSRSAADCIAAVPRALEGCFPFTSARAYLHVPGRQEYAPAAGSRTEEPAVSPTLLRWAAERGEVCSVPVEGGALCLVPIPGQFRPLGVLILSSEEDAGTLNRTRVLMLELLARQVGRVLENLRVYDQIRGLRELLDNIVESVPQGILAVGKDDTVVSCNRNSEILFGIRRLEVLGERYDQALPKPLAELLSSLIVDILREGGTRDAEFSREISATERIPIGIGCTILRDKEERPQGFLFICRDLSLSMEVQKLRELDRMKSEFVHTVSHELKTPLTAILGGAEVLQSERDSLTPDQREILDIIEQGGRRLHALISDLLDLSRLESGRIGLDRAETDLGALIAEAVEGVRHKNPKCTVALDVPEDFPHAMVDPDKLRQVFENLIGNALKYSPGGGEVAVRLALDGAAIRFTVSDHGIGIAPEHIPMLFEKFYRVDSSTTAEIEGTGLGLVIVKHIVDLHEGEVIVESAPGKGSTFGFRIPLVVPSTESP